MVHLKTLFLTLCVISPVYSLAINARNNIFNNSNLSVSQPNNDNSTDDPVNPLTALKVCTSNASGECTIVNDAAAFSWKLASLIESQSILHRCNLITSFVEGNNFAYSYYATGPHCDTTAEEEILAGALNKYLKAVADYRIYGTTCLRLDHGGAWRGWLMVGKPTRFDYGAYCGPDLHLADCSSGGNNDI
ncbi:uncharacterized protein BJX67DRAFT_383804 [Aspergillus lucknowensis]|uniref:Secreted protein CSS2 C-terminal domain-containing protein n=1 Tax=Aspergillus lucknowensis TaxID=176173 RepID=A0ABR4LIJ8_9EURO